jgi:hypothetical protein
MAPTVDPESTPDTEETDTMTDNPNYRLQRRIDHARAKANVSIDPADHMVANALQGVADAEAYRIEREAHDAAHGVADTSDLPPASARLCDICGVRPAELELGDDGVCAVCLAADDTSGL